MSTPLQVLTPMSAEILCPCGRRLGVFVNVMSLSDRRYAECGCGQWYLVRSGFGGVSATRIDDPGQTA